MRLDEIADDEPLIWHMLEKLVDSAPKLMLNVKRGSNAFGTILKVRKVRFSNDLHSVDYNIGTGERALMIGYLGPSDWVTNEFYLGLDADEEYTIKKIDGVPTLVDAHEAD